MTRCPECGKKVDFGDRFCRACGKELREAVSAPAAQKPAGPKKRRMVGVIALANVLLVGGAVFMVAGKGCSSVKGNLAAAGEPLGSFTFVPAQCRSGQRMSFHGVALLGKGPQDGGILAIEDAVRGKLLKVEIPGSCKPPDYEICKVVEVTPDQCQIFDLQVHRTGTQVNDIRLMKGTLRLSCAFRQGGTATADFEFSRCD